MGAIKALIKGPRRARPRKAALSGAKAIKKARFASRQTEMRKTKKAKTS